MTSTFDLKKAVETAGREIPLQNLSSLGMNRVRVLRMSDIHQLVQAVVAQSIETRVLAEAQAESESLAAQIALKEAQLRDAMALTGEKTRALEEELKTLESQKSAALADLEERKLEWELEKEQLAAEAHDKVKAALQGVTEQKSEQESRLRLTEAAKEELAGRLAGFVEESEAERARHAAELDTLRTELDTARAHVRDKARLENLLETLAAEKAALSGHLEELREQARRALEETRRARGEFEEALSRFAREKSVARQDHEKTLAAERSQFEGEKAQLEALLGDARQSLEDESRAHTLLKEEHAALEGRSREIRSFLERLQADNSKLEASLAELQRVRASLATEASALAQRLSGIERSFADLESRHAQSLEEVATATLLAEERLKRVEALGLELEGARKRSSELEGQIRSLQRQTHDQQVELGREEEARRSVEAELQDRTQALGELRSQLASAHLAMTTLRGLHEAERSDNLTLRGEKAELEAALEDSRTRDTETLAKLEAAEARVVEQASEVAGGRTEILALESERKTLSAERDDLVLKVALQEETLRDRQREIARQSEALTRARAALEEAARKSAEDVSALTTKQVELEAVAHTLTQEREEAARLRAAQADLRRTASGAEEGRTKALELLSAERGRREALELRVPDLELQAARKTELEAELAAVRAELVREGGESLRLTQERDQWKARSGELADSLRQIETAQRSWEARCREYQKAYLTRKQGHLKVQEEAAALRDRVKVLEDDLREFEAAQGEHLRELSDFDALKKSSREAEAQLKSENDSLLKSFNRLTQELEASRQSLAQRDEALKAERERVASFRRQMGALLLTETERLLGPAPADTNQSV